MILTKLLLYLHHIFYLVKHNLLFVRTADFYTNHMTIEEQKQILIKTIDQELKALAESWLRNIENSHLTIQDIETYNLDCDDFARMVRIKLRQ